MNNNVQKIKNFLQVEPEGGFDLTPDSIGDGAWELCIVMHKIPCGIVDSITLTGSNGTHSPADDLWGQWDNIYFQATGRRWFN